jgi:hypothetical protein
MGEARARDSRNNPMGGRGVPAKSKGRRLFRALEIEWDGRLFRVMPRNRGGQDVYEVPRKRNQVRFGSGSQTKEVLRVSGGVRRVTDPAVLKAVNMEAFRLHGARPKQSAEGVRDGGNSHNAVPQG